MTTTVKELRLSLVWTKTFSKDLFMPYLADSHRYKSEFNLARANQGDWLLPWQPGEWQRFWQFYLNVSENGDLDKIDADTARENLIPLRAPKWAQMNNFPGHVKRVNLEGFCFPHCVGAIGTIFLQFADPLPLMEAVSWTVKARHYKQYGVDWQDNGSASHGNLNNLANELINKIYDRVLKEDQQGLPLSEPITIATIIDSEGVWVSEGSEDELIDRALYGLCLLEPKWKKGNMEDLVDKFNEPVTGGLGIDGDRFYSLERGRAIWLPFHFSDAPQYSEDEEERRRSRSLGCYHRNLTLATLQTQSLIRLMKRANDFLAEDRRISMRISNSVKIAANILWRLLLGSYDTYRCWSLERHINYNLETLLEPVSEAVGEYPPEGYKNSD